MNSLAIPQVMARPFSMDCLAILARTISALAVVCFCGTAGFSAEPGPDRERTSLDAGWRFLQADTNSVEAVSFDDSHWRKLDLPHDWSIAGPFAETNQTGGSGGFLPSGVAWYRKHFTQPKTEVGKCVSIEFDGVMQNSDVWINGFHLGHRPNGSVSFRYDLTRHLNFGRDNVIAVRCDTSAQPASRWYYGAGIYRHVHLLITDPVHIEPWGVFVSTSQFSAD